VASETAVPAVLHETIKVKIPNNAAIFFIRFYLIFNQPCQGFFNMPNCTQPGLNEALFARNGQKKREPFDFAQDKFRRNKLPKKL
jgi:hypothetical protein